MVRVRDEAKKRVESKKQMLEELKEKLDSQTKKFQWVVFEVTPAYNTGGYYDQDFPEKKTPVSPAFDSEEDANIWMNKHEADEGKHLKVFRRRLIERTVTEWVWY